MGKMQRDKGARGEREVMALLQPIVDKVCAEMKEVRFELRRNQDQRFAAKQFDLIGIPWMAIEIKRVEDKSGLLGWWRQTLAATQLEAGQIPVLIYRANNMPWTVRMRVPIAVGKKVRIKATVTVDIGTFLVWFEHTLRDKMR